MATALPTSAFLRFARSIGCGCTAYGYIALTKQDGDNLNRVGGGLLSPLATGHGSAGRLRMPLAAPAVLHSQNGGKVHVVVQ